MNKLMPFIFLIGLYAYSFETNNITSIHTPVFTVFAYVAAIAMCASFIVNIKKTKTASVN
ncbi:hypothetical protein O0Q50_23805 [Priestia aryabhattai]|uniref:Uncharacterized protein n=1 Tax=Priestia aryabhattai TaxID=412384 RepID=A0AAX6NFD4_PRIAR|nr:hypothetical protein [Priestia aryabhattai]MDU9694215.1 hypothetical protein [Priestia aryabhattai]